MNEKYRLEKKFNEIFQGGLVPLVIAVGNPSFLTSVKEYIVGMQIKFEGVCAGDIRVTYVIGNHLIAAAYIDPLAHSMELYIDGLQEFFNTVALDQKIGVTASFKLGDFFEGKKY